jgi:NADPH:quinone reductase-like Zn-dependent oxidoreductase
LVAIKPSNMTHEQAAAIPLAGATALQGLRDHGDAGEGTHVLNNGASGGVGHLAVQVAKHLGCEVTGVCSTRNVDMVRSLGADHVVDYTADDFATVPGGFDVILDLVGNRSLRDLRRALAPGGAYIASHGQPEHRWLGPILFLARMAVVKLLTRDRLTLYVTRQSADDLRLLGELAAAGTIRPVIDRSFPLEQVADAFRYLESWRARGKVVITF